MKCIILAAGYATRLYPLTLDRPKPLLPVAGKSIIDWLVDDIGPVIDSFVVISNHRFYPQFREWAEGKAQDITVLDDGTENNETRLGAVKDILFAVESLKISDDCVVMAGDNVLDCSLKHFVAFAREKGTSCVMCHEEKRLAALQKTAVIEMDPEGLITSYQEKPVVPRGSHAVPPFYYYLSGDLTRIGEALKDGCAYDSPGSFAAWLSRREKMHAWLMPGKRYDIGDMQSYRFVRDNYKGVIL